MLILCGADSRSHQQQNVPFQQQHLPLPHGFLPLIFLQCQAPEITQTVPKRVHARKHRSPRPYPPRHHPCDCVRWEVQEPLHWLLSAWILLLLRRPGIWDREWDICERCEDRESQFRRGWQSDSSYQWQWAHTSSNLLFEFWLRQLFPSLAISARCLLNPIECYRGRILSYPWSLFSKLRIIGRFFLGFWALSGKLVWTIIGWKNKWQSISL